MCLDRRIANVRYPRSTSDVSCRSYPCMNSLALRARRLRSRYSRTHINPNIPLVEFRSLQMRVPSESFRKPTTKTRDADLIFRLVGERLQSTVGFRSVYLTARLSPPEVKTRPISFLAVGFGH